MNVKLITHLKETLIIPIAAILSLVFFSMIIGWNLVTLLLFWFILIPIMAYKLPAIVSKKERFLKQSIVGLSIFYAIMLFMIYDHYQTDYFKVMLVSFGVNLGLVCLVNWVRKQEKLSDEIS